MTLVASELKGEEMNELALVFGKIVDRYMISSLLSIVISSVLLIFIKEDNIFIIEYGKVISFVVLWISILLILEMLKYLLYFVRLKSVKRNVVSVNEKLVIDKNIEIMMYQIDEMSVADKGLLYNFLETDNEPIIRIGNTFYASDSLLSSNWVHSSAHIVEFDSDAESQPVDNLNRVNSILIAPNNSKKKYRLKNDIFMMLKYIYQEKKKLSHFD